ncbi:MAG TPA: hypothetical protein VGB88_01560 [Alphaproteobacteria bacterium]
MPGSSQQSWSLIYFAIGGGFALAFLVAILALSRARARPYWLFAVLAVPVVALFANPDWRLYSAHALYHYSIVYQIFEHGVPPSLPLAAGVDLKYFYAIHFVIAQLMRLFAFPPAWAFATLGVACLLAMVLVLDRLARRVSDDIPYRWLVLTVILFGSAVLVGDPIGRALANTGVIVREGRLDLLHKFIDINNNQLGLVLYALAFLGLVNLVGEGGRERAGLVQFATGYVLAGVFYPPAWLGVCIAAAVAVGQMVALTRPIPWRKIAQLSAIGVVGLAVLAPWLLSLTVGKSADSAIRPTLGLLARNAPILAAALAVPVLLALYKSELLVRHFRERPRLFGFLALSMIVLQAAFLLVYLPTDAEYKMINFASVPLGLMFALVLRQMFDQVRVLATVVLFLVLLPFSQKIGTYLVFGWPVSDPATTAGRYIVDRVPAQQALYQWIAAESPDDAVFIDSYVTVPAFARRPLLIGTEFRRERGELHVAGEMGLRKDGWGPVIDLMLQINGVDPDLAARRLAIAGEFLAETDRRLSDEVFAALRGEVPGRPVYVVARHGAVITRLARDRRLTSVFQNRAATLFRIAAAG